MLDIDLGKRKSQIAQLHPKQKQQALKIIAAASLLIESEIIDPNLSLEGVELDEEFEEGPYRISSKKTAYGNHLRIESHEGNLWLEMLDGALISAAGITLEDVEYWEQIHRFDYDLKDTYENSFFNL